MTRLHQVKVQILGEVMAKHCVTPEELVGDSRMADVLAARREATVRLKAAGFHPAAIARTLKRNHSTILNYLDSKYGDRKRDRTRAHRALDRLSPDHQRHRGRDRGGRGRLARDADRRMDHRARSL
jgi:hypothetical protein